MEKWQIKISTFAEDELFAECKYFNENYSERYAEKFELEFYQQVKTILPNPFVYPECRFLPTKNPKYRNIVWGNYLIIYRIKAKMAEVLTLFHTSQHQRKVKRARRR